MGVSGHQDLSQNWIASAESVLGPYDLAGAREIDDPTLYVGKFIDDRETGETKFLAFRNETGGQFIGEITDPYAVTWDGDRLAIR